MTSQQRCKRMFYPLDGTPNALCYVIVHLDDFKEFLIAILCFLIRRL